MSVQPHIAKDQSYGTDFNRAHMEAKAKHVQIKEDFY